MDDNGLNITFNFVDSMTRLNKKNGSVVDPRVQAQATTGIMFALGFYTVCGCLIVILFSVLRPRYQSTYAPKLRQNICQPPLLPSSLFGWAATVFNLEESYILNNVGLDAVMLLRFYKFGIYLFGILSFFGLIVIAPVNYFGGRHVKITYLDDLNNTISDEIIMLRSISIENIPNQSPLIKVHLVFCYVISFTVFLLVARFYHSWAQIRMHFCRKLIRLQHKRIETRSILVTGIPQSLRSEETLFQYFSELNIGKVESVVMSRLWTRLQHALSRRTHHLLLLESTCTDMVGNPIKFMPLRREFADETSSRWSSHSNSDDEELDADDSFVNKTPPLATKQFSPQEIQELQANDSVHDVEKDEDDAASVAEFGFDLGDEEVTLEEKTYYQNMYEELEMYLEKFAYRSSSRLGSQKQLLGTVISQNRLLQRTFARFIKWDVRVRRLRSCRTSSPPTTMAFVIFDNPRTAVAISRSVVSPREFMMLTRLAPEPRDIFWANIASPVASPLIKLFRNALARVALVVIAFTWLAPVSFFAGLLSLDKLQGVISGLGNAVNSMHPWVSSFLQNVLPTSALALWLGCLPLVLQYLTYFQGIEAVSWIEMYVFEKYYFYQIFNVMIIMTVAGTVISSVEKYLESNFTTVVATLGSAFATISPFFINYTLLQGLVLGPLELLMPAGFCWRLFRRMLPYCKTPRDWARTCTFNKSSLHYGIVYASPILIFTVGLTYSTIQPLILPFSTLFYGLNYLVLKYRFVYVHVPRYETGGKFTPMVVKRLMFGIGFYQVVLAGILSLKGFYVIAVPSLIPLLVMTIYVNRLLSEGCEVLADTCPLRIIADELGDDTAVTATSELRDEVCNARVESVEPTAHTLNRGHSLRSRLYRGISFRRPAANLQGDANVSRVRAPKPEPLFEEKYKRFECDDKTDYKETTMERCRGILDITVDNIHAYISEIEYSKKPGARAAVASSLFENDQQEEDDLQMRSYLHPAIIGKIPQLWLPKPRF